MYRVDYSKQADKTLRKWKKSNPVLFKKATDLLLEIMEHPRTGLGHPEGQGDRSMTQPVMRFGALGWSE